MALDPAPQPGAVYDVSAAVAVYWPDVHPCGALRTKSWLILTPDGGFYWNATISDRARYLGMVPGFVRTEGTDDAW